MNKKAFVLLMLLWLTLRATASAWYDPHTQSFLSRDPIREAGGINLYAYCEGDPVGNFDPIGLSELIDAGLDASGMPQVQYWDWAHWWGPIVGGGTSTWWQTPSEAELARLFRRNAGGGWRLASESERHDVFWQQFNASLPGAMQRAGESFDSFAKLNGGAFAAVSGVGLLAEGGLTLGTGVVVAHEAWFTGSSWSSLATGNNYPATPEGALALASGASPGAVNATDALMSLGVPFLAGRGPLLRMPEPTSNPFNYRPVYAGFTTGGLPTGWRYVGPSSQLEFPFAKTVSGSKLTYLYQKLSATGGHLKFGISDNPATRYTAGELNGGQLNIIAKGSREEMLFLERQLHETLPIGPEEGQLFYIQRQIQKGLKPPPY